MHLYSFLSFILQFPPYLSSLDFQHSPPSFSKTYLFLHLMILLASTSYCSPLRHNSGLKDLGSTVHTEILIHQGNGPASLPLQWKHSFSPEPQAELSKCHSRWQCGFPMRTWYMKFSYWFFHILSYAIHWSTSQDVSYPFPLSSYKNFLLGLLILSIMVFGCPLNSGESEHKRKQRSLTSLPTLFSQEKDSWPCTSLHSRLFMWLLIFPMKFRQNADHSWEGLILQQHQAYVGTSHVFVVFMALCINIIVFIIITPVRTLHLWTLPLCLEQVPWLILPSSLFQFPYTYPPYSTLPPAPISKQSLGFQKGLSAALHPVHGDFPLAACFLVGYLGCCQEGSI